jgi:hypothetical protein
VGLKTCGPTQQLTLFEKQLEIKMIKETVVMNRNLHGDRKA